MKHGVPVKVTWWTPGLQYAVRVEGDAQVLKVFASLDEARAFVAEGAYADESIVTVDLATGEEVAR